VQVSTERSFTSGLIGGDRPVSLGTTTSLAVTGLSSQIRYYRIRSVIPTNEGPVKTGWSPAVSAPNMTSFGKYVSLNATGNADNFQPASSSSPDNNSYTITFWMRPDKLGGTSGTENVQVIRQAINSGAGTANVDLDLLPDGSLCFGQKDAAGSSKFVQTAAKTVLASNWHHVALVRDSTNSTLRIYLNGQDVATNLGAFGLTSWTINNSLGFGATQDALNDDNNLNRFKCAMDDVRVYRAVRTPAQIIQDLSAPLAPTEASANSALVFYAPMEGSSLINTDTSTLSKGSFNAAGSGTITSQSVTPTPILSWTPSPINLNAPAVLSTNELTASAQAPTGGPVAGLWSYSPDAGTSLAVGTNAVVGTFVPTDLNSYSIGAITNQIVVAPAAKLNPTVTVNVGSYTYNGSYQGPGVSDVNKGGSTGALTLQYGGSSMVGVQYGPATIPPTEAGNYTLVATVAADANYSQGVASANFTISKATATVNVSGTDQIYDGMPKQVNVSTSPENLPVTIMYSGSSAAPTLAGDYSVMVTVTSANYSGAASGRILKIAKGTPLLSGITATSITAGQALSNSTISGTAKNATGADVAGNWTFQNSSSTPSAGTNDQGVIFTSNDTANYSTATASVSVTVALDPTGDQDGDGLTNAQELTLGTNPYQKDSDNDGVNDSKEVADGTSPTDASSYNSLSKGLVAYYPFSGNANDSSGNGNSGTPVSPVLSADRLGAANAAYTFNGTSDRIDLANSAALNMNNGVPFSMSAWIKTDFSDGQRVILAKAAGAWGNTPALFVDNEGKLRFDNFYINEVHSSTTVRTGTWMHVAVTYDGSTYRLYVNGLADGEKAFTGSNESGNSWTFSIGGSLNTTFPSGMFKGSIDEVQFWGRTLSPTEVAAVAGIPSTPFTCTIANGQVTITGYTGTGGNVEIPATIGGLPVTQIGNEAFKEKTSITAITFPDSVLKIGDGAFYHCEYLDTVTFGGGVTTIGDWAFGHCYKLKSISIPNSVTSLGNGSLSDCVELESVELGNQLQGIGRYTFTNDYKLTNLTIPASVTSIGEQAFSHCRKLATINFQQNMPPAVNADSFMDVANGAMGYYPATAVLNWAGVTYYGITLRSNDQVAPVIALIGANELTIYKGSVFIDPGATVTDNVDATRTIAGSGTVNTATVGAYTLTYTATDASGNPAAQVTRVVSVVLNPAGDEDGDGATNEVELTIGTNPYDSASGPYQPVANVDAFTAKLAAGMTTKVTTASLISNDKYSGIPGEERGVFFVSASAASTKGATIEVKAGWLIYRPSSSAQNGTSDTFTYTVSNGIKTATGTVTVSLVTPEYVAEVAIDRVSGDKAYFSVMPGMTFEVQGASQPGTSATWTVLPNGANPYWTSGADGRLIVTDPAAVGSAYRFYKFRWIP